MNMKRLLSLALALVLVLTMVPVTARAATVASGNCGAKVTWTLDDEGTLTISGTGPMDDWESSYFRPWFNWKDEIVKVVIGNGVTTIGETAFWFCNILESVSIPDSVTAIGGCAFYGCASLNSVTFGSGLKTIGESAFYDCESLGAVILKHGVTTIGYEAFKKCDRLIRLVIPRSVTAIRKGAFQYSYNISLVCYDGTKAMWDKINIAADNEELYPKIGIGYNENGDHKCDKCEFVFGECVDDNSDHKCDICTKETQCKDANRDHKCDLCAKVISQCKDDNKNHKCDICVKEMQCKDDNKNHKCDMCAKEISKCKDEDRNHICDICKKELSKCKDDNKNHRCDYCYQTISKCTYEKNADKCDICGAVAKMPANVTRLAGEYRWTTALAVANTMKEKLNGGKFNAIIIASGHDFADALAGSYLAAVRNAPILLSWGNGGKFQYLDTDNIQFIKDNLAEDGVVYILGGTSAVPELYELELEGYPITRLGGADRFETNLMILEAAGVADGSEILVCTSTNFADSLSASAVGKPILLVFNESGKLYGRQPAFLAELNKCTFTIIGGENAVSQKLADEIGKYGKVTRLAGANRFETSVKVAQQYFKNPDSAVLAYAWNYPDGLCGGSLAYTMCAPLILTMTKYESQAADYIQSKGIKKGIVLGGEKLIANGAVINIFGN